jgi:hypothetical protein
MPSHAITPVRHLTRKQRFDRVSFQNIDQEPLCRARTEPLLGSICLLSRRAHHGMASVVEQACSKTS